MLGCFSAYFYDSSAASALEVAPPPLSPSGLRDQDYDLSTGQTSDSEAQWGGAWATESHTSEEPASPRIGGTRKEKLCMKHSHSSSKFESQQGRHLGESQLRCRHVGCP